MESEAGPGSRDPLDDETVIARVVVASNDAVYAGALGAVLSRWADVTVANGNPSKEIDELRPDLVVWHWSDFTPRQVAGISERSALLVLGPSDSETMLKALEAGALGYADAEAPFTDIDEAAALVAAGRVTAPPHMLGSLLRYVVERGRTEREARSRLEALTVRQQEVFELAARQLDHHQIAKTLFISPATARTHLQNLMKTLELHSRAELVALASRCGLDVTPDPDPGEYDDI